jgi:CMP-N-acetylneuraminic acid synthetase
LYSGRIKTVEVPVARSLDIDTEDDFAMAEFLLQRAQIGRNGGRAS